MSGNNLSVTVNLDGARQRLRALQKLAKPAIRDSVNDTAKKARSRLDDKVKEVYAIKKSGFNKAVKGVLQTGHLQPILQGLLKKYPWPVLRTAKIPWVMVNTMSLY